MVIKARLMGGECLPGHAVQLCRCALLILLVYPRKREIPYRQGPVQEMLWVGIKASSLCAFKEFHLKSVVKILKSESYM